MPNNIINTPVSWNQEDAAKYFLQPLFVMNEDMKYFDVMTDISGAAIKLDKYSAMKNVTNALNAGEFVDNNDQSTNSQVTLTLTRLEIEVAQQAHSLWNHIKSQMMKRGIARNDLSGTLLMEIISELLMGGIMRDFSTILWWGQTTSGVGTQDLADGIWEACNSIPAGQRVTYTGTVLDDLNSLMTARTPELAASEQVMFVSRSFAEKYRAELTAIGVQGAYVDLQNGLSNLSFNGIPMIVKPDFDVNIADYGASLSSNGPSATTKVECAMLLAKGALAVGTDWEIQDVDMWYNKDFKQNRFRMNYSFGCALKDDSMCATITY
jgi:hypothetical protein